MAQLEADFRQLELHPDPARLAILSAELAELDAEVDALADEMAESMLRRSGALDD